MINYESEVKRLDSFVPGENSQFWKPKTGQFRVKALTELEDTNPFVPKGDHKPEDEKAQAKIDLLIGEERVTWTIGKAVSPASAYGQLCKLATLYGNKLGGVEFMIVVTNDKKKNTYTIVKL
jgi:hypothetical protein